MLEIYPEKKYTDAAEFCKLFLHEKARPRYVLGRNEYAVSIARNVDINGFIDDFTRETEFLGKPILKMTEIPKESMVVSAVIFVVPLTALIKLQNHGFACLDYFNFCKYSGVALKEIDFLRESREDIERNLHKYERLYDRLEDKDSKDVLSKLINFRASSDLNYMRGFENAQDRQYFEDFLELKPGEVFIDAGGFDGQTTIEFIKRCPEYKTIYIFEPASKNVALARNNLSSYNNIYLYTMGLAENKKTLKFSSGEGSASKLSATGDVEIEVDAIDNLINESISFIKMDIEGAEENALQGARAHILKDHPKLAICCYHKVADLWMIPQQIMAMRDDYSIYLRHYTDGFHETVMYFIPDT
ncbi:MAG: FkbM family methyltransferase [Deltaproteobacteria bacterium]|nr:FkbM family methyltransferase [Deltaproteobacteria bacterium]